MSGRWWRLARGHLSLLATSAYAVALAGVGVLPISWMMTTAPFRALR